MLRARRRRSKWRRSLEPFDVMVILCALLLPVNFIVFCLFGVLAFAVHLVGVL